MLTLYLSIPYYEATGTREAGDQPLAWVGLKVEELGTTVYTRGDGTLYLEHVPLGTYTLRVLRDTLPAGTRVLGEDRFALDITPDSLFVRGIAVPVVYGRGNEHSGR